MVVEEEKRKILPRMRGGDSIGVPPVSGAEKSQKTVTEKSADAAQADTMTFWEALSESEAGIEVIEAVSSAV